MQIALQRQQLFLVRTALNWHKLALAKYSMSDELHFYSGFSLVDITATGVTRFRPEVEHERNQQRNWETTVQVLGLRTQPLHVTGPVCKECNISQWFEVFGEMYEGVHKVWMWSWAVDREDIFLIGDDQKAGLYKDFEQVPVVTGLDETARFLLPIFHPYGAIKNIHFVLGAMNFDNL